MIPDPASWWTWVALVVALLLTLLGLVVGAVLSLVLTSGEKLDQNGYGVVAGSSSYDGKDSLSDWLADTIDSFAGRPTDGAPLTFGDLWKGPDGTGTARAPHVNLEMLTTNVTQGRPMRLPDELGPDYCFTEKEFRLLFPERVVQHLKAHRAIDRFLADEPELGVEERRRRRDETLENVADIWRNVAERRRAGGLL